MKRCIDANELKSDLEKCRDELGEYGFIIDFVNHIIDIQTTIICVSDDFECDCGYICGGVKNGN